MYDTIITFSNGMEAQLLQAQEHYAETDPDVGRAKILQLSGCYKVPDLKDQVKVTNLHANIIFGIHDFIAEDLVGWSTEACEESKD